MKKVEAVIRHHRVEEVKKALHDVGVSGATFAEVKGFGRQKGHTELHRGAEYVIDLVPKLKLEVVVAESLLDSTVEAIKGFAHTGKIGDGKIFVTHVEEVIRIRTGERDVDAV